MALSWKTKGIIAAVMMVCLAIIIVSVVLSQINKRASEDEQLPTLECVASATNEDVCKRAGCIWNIQDPRTPNCTLPERQFGYRFDKFDPVNNIVDLKVKKGSFFGTDFKKPRMEIVYINTNVLRVKFVDAESSRYQVPVPLNLNFPKPSEDSLKYSVSFSKNPDELFYFRVSRNGTKTLIFDSSVGSLFLADRHIEVTTRLATPNVYGIGENTHNKFKHDLNYVKWPLFSRDQFPDADIGNGRLNLYGVHPFYTCLEESGKSHGVLFFSSNAMEVFLTPSPTLTFRSTGGVLDMFFFLGDSPEHVVQLYTEVIGRPMIPPYWSLGFQLSRYGFNSLDNMKAAIRRTKEKNIPLDVVHADIDHMKDNKDFTWDQDRFKDFPQFVKDEKKDGLRVIIILDPALLANDRSYTPYTDGETEDVFIKWPSDIKIEDRNYPEGVSKDKDIMFGKVWPLGPVAFPDYFKQATVKWWEKCIVDYRQELDFDALWIDMNEPAAFETDVNEPWFCPENDKKCWSLKCPDNPHDNITNTFRPAAITVYGKEDMKLSDKTLCMAGVQGEDGVYRHFDVHSLYGWSQTESTYNALKRSAGADQVPLVISRSTFPSSGRFTGHWLGDNKSRWQDLRASIIGMLEFNLFGIPYVGADICGFFLNTTSELCGRWMQLGSFYPFCRNHNNNEPLDQDPGNEAMMKPVDIARSRDALNTRYQLLPYLHTLHYLANRHGSTVVRPLFHEYMNDPKTYDIQEQFLWGPALLISPALYENQKQITFYLPDDVWYDFHRDIKLTVSGQTLTADDTEKVPLHVRGGYILPLKEAGALNTKQSRSRDFEIRVYPKNSQAKGELFWMAEEAKDAENTETYSFFEFLLDSNQLTIKATWSGKLENNHLQIGMIRIHDVSAKPTAVKFDNSILLDSAVSYDDSSKILQITHPINLLDLDSKDASKSTKILEWA